MTDSTLAIGLGTLGVREVVAHAAYLASVVMFMVAIARLGRVKSAWGGNVLAAAAMLLAVVGQFVESGAVNPAFVLAGMVLGGLAGTVAARRVKMTQMPEMVALLNGCGGLASAFVGLATYWNAVEAAHATGREVGTVADLFASSFTGTSLVLTVVVGAVTFSGSVVAYLKLAEKIAGAPILLPRRHLLNAAVFVAALLVGALATWTFAGPFLGSLALLVVLATALALGIGLVIPIGGGDMPVVISLLNSYSGVAGALAGFTIHSPVLVVAGSLVGASGLILTRIMCKSMNRSLGNVVFGGFGAVDAASPGGGEYRNVRSVDAEEAAMVLADARSVIFVPGYGMAVAQAQHALKELGDLLKSRGCRVRYAVHPVAGRMPGHMNVLLAEANVPYDDLYEMDAIDADFKTTDAAVVIGANDVVNPAAKTNAASPLYGMPVLSVDDARTVFVIKRSLGAGFAGVKNELFERENARMLYMDGRKACEALTKAVKDL